MMNIPSAVNRVWTYPGSHVMFDRMIGKAYCKSERETMLGGTLATRDVQLLPHPPERINLFKKVELS